jgi:hypothetical protein
MDGLSVKYQNDRTELETADISRLVLRAIVYCIVPDAAEPFSLEQMIRSASTGEWLITTTQITEKCRDLIAAEELDFDLELMNSRRIGRAIGKLRLTKKSDGKRRGWQIHAQGLEKHLKSHYLLTSPDVSDVIYPFDVNKESAPNHPETSELTADLENYASTTESLNVSIVNNVSNVNNVNNVNPIASCEYCMRFTAPIGTLCPNCDNPITDPLGQIQTDEEQAIIHAEAEAVSHEAREFAAGHGPYR